MAKGKVETFKGTLLKNKTFTEIWLESKKDFSKRDAVNQFKGLVKQYETSQAVSANYVSSEVFKTLEGLRNDEERIAIIERFLLDNGFDVEIHYSSKNNITVFYTKENIDTVFCVLLDWVEVTMTVIDKDVFLKMARDSNNTKISFSLTVKREKGKLNEIYTYSSGVYCPVYHLAFGKLKKGKGVDHITRHIGINIRDYLRVCDNAKNNLNKRPVLRVSADDVFDFKKDEEDKNCCYFSVSKGRVSKSDIKNLKRNGYTIKDGRVVSPKLNMEQELLQEINKVLVMITNKLEADFENKSANITPSSFNYNPLVDFQDTWYALVLYKLFPNNISRRDIKNYNRNYFRRNHKKIAEVYNL